MTLDDIPNHHKIKGATIRAIRTMERVSGKPVNLPKALTALGYRRTSHRHGIVSRIDRPDWREHMAGYHPDGSDWVKSLCCRPGQAEDYYRRCISRDKIELGAGHAAKFLTSDWDATGYVEIR